mmetsp:Transcript_18053/g.58437  ORF Transcript_18053/g.58437 Transcript_18053/m.58437 type:complete len:189 (+) Transcript_18053:264-830(+)
MSASAPLAPNGLVAPSAAAGGLRLLRPLRGARRRDLRALCVSRGVEWEEDPTNQDMRYLRNRIRRVLERSAPESVVEDCERVRGACERARGELLGASAALLEEMRTGGGALRSGPLRAARPAVARRAMSAALCLVSGRRVPPRTRTVADLLGRMAGGRMAGPFIGAGCRVMSVPRSKGALFRIDPLDP